MTTMSSDLEQFLEVVGRVSASVATEAGNLGDRWAAVESAGLPSLALDTGGEPDALQWLAHAVRVAAESSPSLAFTLASRYTADLVLGEQATEAPAFALVSQLSGPVVPTSPVPDAVVLLDVDRRAAVSAPWPEIEGSLEATSRTGLAAACLATFPHPASGRSLDGDPADMLRAWDVLTGAALIGIAERAVERTNAYVLERKQFGVPIGSFAGLRALVAGMTLRVEPVRAQLDLALERAAASDSISALAGRVAVDNCLDAIQSHGGYGYITEYPFADLLRDAISLQARSGGRRLHVARVAERGLGEPTGRR